DAFRFGPPRQKGVSFIRARWHDFRRYPDRHMTSTMRDALAPCASEADLDRSFVWMRSCSPAGKLKSAAAFEAIADVGRR
ncbi:hypothetical protein ABTN00_19820, partial [Acinetobacter baumannii]